MSYCPAVVHSCSLSQLVVYPDSTVLSDYLLVTYGSRYLNPSEFGPDWYNPHGVGSIDGVR